MSTTSKAGLFIFRYFAIVRPDQPPPTTTTRCPAGPGKGACLSRRLIEKGISVESSLFFSFELANVAPLPARVPAATPVLRPALRSSLRESRLLEILFSWRMALSAAAAVALLVFLIYNPFQPALSSGPSAIIDSFTGQVKSVMILETPQNRQTVIWYSEESKAENAFDPTRI